MTISTYFETKPIFLSSLQYNIPLVISNGDSVRVLIHGFFCTRLYKSTYHQFTFTTWESLLFRVLYDDFTYKWLFNS